MAQIVRYIAGFETGDAGELSVLGAGASVVTTPVRTGGYALKQAATASTLNLLSLASTQTVIRFYLRVPALPGADTLVFIEQTATPAARLEVSLTSAGHLKVLDAAATLGLVTVTGTAVLAINTWYRVEVAFDLAAAGVIQVLVDGTLDINTTHSSNVAATTTSRLQLSGAATTNEYFFDDVRIDIGGLAAIGAGQIIARQGIAGTPTYNAWTKTGAATSALCWSDTPFATATNCSSSTSSAAQTMVVGTFSGAGSASEGAQIVGASDIINACKVAIVAKRATGGFPFIRRRVNGVDTDTSWSGPSTSDQYLDSGIWTTTAANLDLLEAGVAKAADANLTTVEDVWVIVDYTPVVVSIPAGKIEYTNPRGYITGIVLKSHLNSLNLNLLGKDKFFAAEGQPLVYDWQNPRGYTPGVALRTHVQGTSLVLLSGVDQFYGAAGQPPANLDWPVPKGRRPIIEQYGFINPIEIQLVGQDQFFGAPGQPPQTQEWPVPKGRQHPQDLRSWTDAFVTTRLSFLVVNPFVNDHSLPPGGRPYPIFLRTHTDPLKLNLYGQDLFFGGAGKPPVNLEWAVPKGRKPIIEQYGFLNPAEVQLFGQDTFFGSPGQPPANLDWPVPKGRKPIIEQFGSTDPLKINLIGQDAFFAGAGRPPTYDWPNPRGRTHPVDLRTWIQNQIPMIGQDTIYGAPGQAPSYDWPNPRGRQYPQDLRSWFDSYSIQRLNSIILPPFFGSTDPVPRGPQYPVALRTWTVNLNLYLQGQDTFFGAPGQPPQAQEWANPRGRQYPSDLRFWSDDFVFTRLSYSLVLPFRNEHPLPPSGRPFPIDLRSFLDPTEIWLFGTDQFFGAPGQPPANLDWPVPKGPVPGIALRTWIDPLRVNLQGKDVFFGAPGQPPANLDWPNPRGRQPDISLRTYIDPLKLNLLNQDVFFGAPGQPPANMDWPVPKGRIPVVSLRTHLDPLKLNLLGQDRFYGGPGQPPLNWEWPVPKGRIPVVSLRTHTDSLRLNLLGKDKFFGAPGQPPANLDWPVPKGRQFPLSLRTFSQKPFFNSPTPHASPDLTLKNLQTRKNTLYNQILRANTLRNKVLRKNNLRNPER